MSHEIRTPMNGVLGMAEILSRSPLALDEQKMVTTIRRSAHSLLELLDDILDLSKIEAGKISLAEEEISLETEMDSLVGLMDRTALDKQVELGVFFDPQLPQLVMGDGLRMRQILINLVGNAIKFSAGMERIGRIQLRAELDDCNDDQVWVIFSITDNGVGMDEETLARLFQPFEQADASTTRKYGGTGLGLSISQNLTALMGGEISATSQPDQGTLFTVRLPFKRLDTCPNRISPYDLSRLECVIVANESRYVNDYTRYLAHAGAQPHTVTDLDSAWNYAAKFSAEIPLCLIIMQDPATHSAQEIVDQLLNQQLGENVHWVNIAYMSVERGRRRKVRRLSDKVVQIDREALTRRRFLEAVTAATERIVIVKETHDDKHLDIRPEARLNILVAEDNEINRDVIQRQLQMLGHFVELTEDGEQAFRKWESGHYHLLLTDLHMPNKDGYELTLMIREAERHNNQSPIPIIALTANAMKGEEERCLAMGMDSYLSKPIDLARLQTVIDEWRPSSALETSFTVVPEPSPTVETTESPVFNPEVLVKMVGNQPSVHHRLLKKFIINSQERTDQLLQAIEKQDTKAVRETAHALKSAARTVGAMRLGELCEKLEHAGTSGDCKTCLELEKTLKTLFSETKQAIKKHE